MDLTTRTFGIEIECGSPAAGELAARIAQAGIRVRAEGYNHETRSYWKIVTDGSIRNLNPGFVGVEVVSPVLTGAEGIAQIEKVCAVLVAQGCIVNATCGMHVHVGASDLTLTNFKSLVKAFNRYEVAMDSFMPASRRASTNHFCKALAYNHSDFNAAVDGASSINTLITRTVGDDRYRKLNLTAFWRHQTVEFRHHSGTVEAEKATQWVRFCLLFVESARKNGKVLTTQVSLQTLTNRLFGRLTTTNAIAKQSKNFYLARQQKFAGRAN